MLADGGYSQEELASLSEPHLGISKLEVDALCALYTSTGGDKWKDRANWCSDKDVSTWKGCKVHDGHLIELNLYGNRLAGEFPEAFFNLPALRLIELGQNNMSGPLPEMVSKLVSLKVWALNSNKLSGTIPAGFGKIRPLDELLLKDNQFEGQVPGSVLNKHGLSLEVSGNKLSASDEVALHVPQWEWYLMSRDNVLQLERIPSHEECKQKGLLHRMNCLFKAYEKWSFENIKNGVTTHVEATRDEVTLFSHRWDTPSLNSDEAHPDRPDNSKLQHVKEYLRAHPHIKLCFMDYWSMQQTAAAWQPPLLEAIKGIKTLPYYVHNSGNFVTLCRDEANVVDYMGRAWCQLEILCCNCPFEAFTQRVYDGVRWVGNEATGEYNAVPTSKLVSIWNNGNRSEQSFDALLASQGGIPDPSSGGLTQERDRPQIAIVCLTVLRAMKTVHEKQLQKKGNSDIETTIGYVNPLIEKLEAFIQTTNN